MTNEERLKVLEAQIGRAQEQNRRLLATKQKIQDSLDAIEGQRAVILRAHAAGDTKAAARLDDLDTSEKGYRRQLGGTEMLLGESNAEIAKLEQERAPILAAVQEASNLKRAAELTQTAEEEFSLVEMLQEQLAAAQVSLAGAVNEVHQHCDGRSDCVDFLNRVNARSEQLARRLQMKIVNEGWQVGPAGFLPRELTVPACLPPEDAASCKAA